MTQPLTNWRRLSEIYPISALADIETIRALEAFINTEKRRGKDSRKHGWAMSQIVEKARHQFNDERAEKVKEMIIDQYKQGTLIDIKK
jgi:hypothetical protein